MGEYTAADRRWMRRALQLARRGWGWTAPNPMVGCVIVRDGERVGEGWHAEFGREHAEVMALNEAGARARGATAYVTLEPCNHVGKTPPCASALIAHGVTRVVFAAHDEHPAARGGANTLRGANIAVHEGLLADEATELNLAFHTRHMRTRPLVTLKLAMSVDGAIAGAARPGVGAAPLWLTGARARRAVHVMRAGHAAVAVGSGTVLADDPLLTVRGVRSPRVPPLRVVFDRRGRVSPAARLVRTARRYPTTVVTRAPAPPSLTALAAAGVEVVPAESLAAALGALHARGVDSLLCEGGAHMAGALLGEGLVDRLVIFQAPVILGLGAVRAIAFGPEPTPHIAARWRVVEHRMLGEDLLTIYAPPA